MFSIISKGNTENKSFFDFSINLIDGKKIELSKFKGRSILLVNVASNCGFTKQYSDLQQLYEVYQAKGLVVLGVPSNQFGGQDPENEKAIKDFCETILQPGDMIYIPYQWKHQCVPTEKRLSLSFPFWI